MTVVLGLFILVVLFGLMFFALVLALPQRIQVFFFTQPGASPIRRALAWLAVPAIIGVSELLAPSLPATGLQPAPVSEPIAFLTQPEWSDADLTYDDVSKLAPWLWPLGMISRGDVRDLLTADMALAGQAKAYLTTLGEPGDLNYDYSAARWANTMADAAPVLRRALLAAIRDLDSLADTENAMVRAVDADLFVAEHIERTYQNALAKAKAASDAAYEAHTAAVAAQDAGTANGSQTARQKALQDAWNQNLRASQLLTAPLSSIQRALDLAQRVVSLSNPEAPFPDLVSPITAVSKTNEIIEPITIQTGPSAGFSLAAVARRMADAVTGHMRRPREWASYQACNVAITDSDSDTAPILGRTCRITRPLFIDYDITIDACGPTGSDSICVESWITPNVTIDFTDKSFTVHAPKPTKPANANDAQASPSRWIAIWDGIEKLITPTATFDWDPTTLQLPNVKLRHELSTSAPTARIWQDFRRDRPFRGLSPPSVAGDGPSSARTFLPITVDAIALPNQAEFVPAFLSLGQDSPDLEARFAQTRRNLLFQIAERQFLLANGFSDGADVKQVYYPTPLATAWASPPCTPARSPIDNMYWEIDLHASARIPKITAQDCPSIRATDSLLETMRREISLGTWLWMIVP